MSLYFLLVFAGVSSEGDRQLFRRPGQCKIDLFCSRAEVTQGHSGAERRLSGQLKYHISLIEIMCCAISSPLKCCLKVLYVWLIMKIYKYKLAILLSKRIVGSLFTIHIPMVPSNESSPYKEIIQSLSIFNFCT